MSEQRFLEPRPGGNWSWSSRDDEEPRWEVEEDDEAPVYVISVAAELADLHPQTLRAYEREGLVSPARTQGGTRRYSRRDVERLQFIRTLTQEQGLNIAGVRVVLELGEKLEGARRRIDELEDMVRVLASRVDSEPNTPRYQIVRSTPGAVEAHPHRRRTGQRSSAPRARPVPPPDSRVG